jgi:hypothetical protein
MVHDAGSGVPVGLPVFCLCCALQLPLTVPLGTVLGVCGRFIEFVLISELEHLQKH